MMPLGMRALIVVAMIALGARVEAQTPCPELIQLRNAATEAWKQAMRVPRSERCGALLHAASATEATLKFADDNHASCGVSGALLNEVDRYHREAVQARDNVCAGRPLRPYPPDIIQR
jgi:hypothetical protein